MKKRKILIMCLSLALLLFTVCGSVFAYFDYKGRNKALIDINGTIRLDAFDVLYEELRDSEKGYGTTPWNPFVIDSYERLQNLIFLNNEGKLKESKFGEDEEGNIVQTVSKYYFQLNFDEQELPQVLDLLKTAENGNGEIQGIGNDLYPFEDEFSGMLYAYQVPGTDDFVYYSGCLDTVSVVYKDGVTTVNGEEVTINDGTPSSGIYLEIPDYYNDTVYAQTGIIIQTGTKKYVPMTSLIRVHQMIANATVVADDSQLDIGFFSKISETGDVHDVILYNTKIVCKESSEGLVHNTLSSLWSDITGHKFAYSDTHDERHVGIFTGHLDGNASNISIAGQCEIDINTKDVNYYSYYTTMGFLSDTATIGGLSLEDLAAQADGGDIGGCFFADYIYNLTDEQVPAISTYTGYDGETHYHIDDVQKGLNWPGVNGTPKNFDYGSFKFILSANTDVVSTLWQDKSTLKLLNMNGFSINGSVLYCNDEYRFKDEEGSGSAIDKGSASSNESRYVSLTPLTASGSLLEAGKYIITARIPDVDANGLTQTEEGWIPTYQYHALKIVAEVDNGTISYVFDSSEKNDVTDYIYAAEGDDTVNIYSSAIWNVNEDSEDPIFENVRFTGNYLSKDSDDNLMLSAFDGAFAYKCSSVNHTFSFSKVQTGDDDKIYSEQYFLNFDTDTNSFYFSTENNTYIELFMISNGFIVELVDNVDDIVMGGNYFIVGESDGKYFALGEATDPTTGATNGTISPTDLEFGNAMPLTITLSQYARDYKRFIWYASYAGVNGTGNPNGVVQLRDKLSGTYYLSFDDNGNVSLSTTPVDWTYASTNGGRLYSAANYVTYADPLEPNTTGFYINNRASSIQLYRLIPENSDPAYVTYEGATYIDAEGMIVPEGNYVISALSNTTETALGMPTNTTFNTTNATNVFANGGALANSYIFNVEETSATPNFKNLSTNRYLGLGNSNTTLSGLTTAPTDGSWIYDGENYRLYYKTRVSHTETPTTVTETSTNSVETTGGLTSGTETITTITYRGLTKTTTVDVYEYYLIYYYNNAFGISKGITSNLYNYHIELHKVEVETSYTLEQATATNTNTFANSTNLSNDNKYLVLSEPINEMDPTKTNRQKVYMIGMNTEGTQPETGVLEGSYTPATNTFVTTQDLSYYTWGHEQDTAHTMQFVGHQFYNQGYLDDNNTKKYMGLTTSGGSRQLTIINQSNVYYGTNTSNLQKPVPSDGPTGFAFVRKANLTDANGNPTYWLGFKATGYTYFLVEDELNVGNFKTYSTNSASGSRTQNPSTTAGDMANTVLGNAIYIYSVVGTSRNIYNLLSSNGDVLDEDIHYMIAARVDSGDKSSYYALSRTETLDEEDNVQISYTGENVTSQANIIMAAGHMDELTMVPIDSDWCQTSSTNALHFYHSKTSDNSTEYYLVTDGTNIDTTGISTSANYELISWYYDAVNKIMKAVDDNGTYYLTFDFTTRLYGVSDNIADAAEIHLFRYSPTYSVEKVTEFGEDNLETGTFIIAGRSDDGYTPIGVSSTNILNTVASSEKFNISSYLTNELSEKRYNEILDYIWKQQYYELSTTHSYATDKTNYIIFQPISEAGNGGFTVSSNDVSVAQIQKTTLSMEWRVTASRTEEGAWNFLNNRNVGNINAASRTLQFRQYATSALKLAYNSFDVDKYFGDFEEFKMFYYDEYEYPEMNVFLFDPDTSDYIYDLADVIDGNEYLMIGISNGMNMIIGNDNGEITFKSYYVFNENLVNSSNLWTASKSFMGLQLENNGYYAYGDENHAILTTTTLDPNSSWVIDFYGDYCLYYVQYNASFGNNSGNYNIYLADLSTGSRIEEDYFENGDYVLIADIDGEDARIIIGHDNTNGVISQPFFDYQYVNLTDNYKWTLSNKTIASSASLLGFDLKNKATNKYALVNSYALTLSSTIPAGYFDVSDDYNLFYATNEFDFDINSSNWNIYLYEEDGTKVTSITPSTSTSYAMVAENDDHNMLVGFDGTNIILVPFKDFPETLDSTCKWTLNLMANNLGYSLQNGSVYAVANDNYEIIATTTPSADKYWSVDETNNYIYYASFDIDWASTDDDLNVYLYNIDGTKYTASKPLDDTDYLMVAECTNGKNVLIGNNAGTIEFKPYLTFDENDGTNSKYLWHADTLALGFTLSNGSVYAISNTSHEIVTASEMPDNYYWLLDSTNRNLYYETASAAFGQNSSNWNIYLYSTTGVKLTSSTATAGECLVVAEKDDKYVLVGVDSSSIIFKPCDSITSNIEDSYIWNIAHHSLGYSLENDGNYAIANGSYAMTLDSTIPNNYYWKFDATNNNIYYGYVTPSFDNAATSYNVFLADITTGEIESSIDLNTNHLLVGVIGDDKVLIGSNGTTIEYIAYNDFASLATISNNYKWIITSYQGGYQIQNVGSSNYARWATGNAISLNASAEDNKYFDLNVNNSLYYASYTLAFNNNGSNIYLANPATGEIYSNETIAEGNYVLVSAFNGKQALIGNNAGAVSYLLFKDFPTTVPNNYLWTASENSEGVSLKNGAYYAVVNTSPTIVLSTTMPTNEYWYNTDNGEESFITYAHLNRYSIQRNGNTTFTSANMDSTNWTTKAYRFTSITTGDYTGTWTPIKTIEDLTSTTGTIHLIVSNGTNYYVLARYTNSYFFQIDNPTVNSTTGVITANECRNSTGQDNRNIIRRATYIKATITGENGSLKVRVYSATYYINLTATSMAYTNNVDNAANLTFDTDTSELYLAVSQDRATKLNFTENKNNVAVKKQETVSNVAIDLEENINNVSLILNETRQNVAASYLDTFNNTAISYSQDIYEVTAFYIMEYYLTEEEYYTYVCVNDDGVWRLLAKDEDFVLNTDYVIVVKDSTTYYLVTYDLDYESLVRLEIGTSFGADFINLQNTLDSIDGSGKVAILNAEDGQYKMRLFFDDGFYLYDNAGILEITVEEYEASEWTYEGSQNNNTSHLRTIKPTESGASNLGVNENSQVISSTTSKSSLFYVKEVDVDGETMYQFDGLATNYTDTTKKYAIVIYQDNYYYVVCNVSGNTVLAINYENALPEYMTPNYIFTIDKNRKFHPLTDSTKYLGIVGDVLAISDEEIETTWSYSYNKTNTGTGMTYPGFISNNTTTSDLFIFKVTKSGELDKVTDTNTLLNSKEPLTATTSVLNSSRYLIVAEVDTDNDMSADKYFTIAMSGLETSMALDITDIVNKASNGENVTIFDSATFEQEGTEYDLIFNNISFNNLEDASHTYKYLLTGEEGNRNNQEPIVEELTTLEGLDLGKYKWRTYSASKDSTDYAFGYTDPVSGIAYYLYYDLTNNTFKFTSDFSIAYTTKNRVQLYQLGQQMVTPDFRNLMIETDDDKVTIVRWPLNEVEKGGTFKTYEATDAGIVGEYLIIAKDKENGREYVLTQDENGNYGYVDVQPYFAGNYSVDNSGNLVIQVNTRYIWQITSEPTTSGNLTTSLTFVNAENSNIVLNINSGNSLAYNSETHQLYNGAKYLNFDTSSGYTVGDSQSKFDIYLYELGIQGDDEPDPYISILPYTNYNVGLSTIVNDRINFKNFEFLKTQIPELNSYSKAEDSFEFTVASGWREDTSVTKKLQTVNSSIIMEEGIDPNHYSEYAYEYTYIPEGASEDEAETVTVNYYAPNGAIAFVIPEATREHPAFVNAIFTTEFDKASSEGNEDFLRYMAIWEIATLDPATGVLTTLRTVEDAENEDNFKATFDYRIDRPHFAIPLPNHYGSVESEASLVNVLDEDEEIYKIHHLSDLEGTDDSWNHLIAHTFVITEPGLYYMGSTYGSYAVSYLSIDNAYSEEIENPAMGDYFTVDFVWGEMEDTFTIEGKDSVTGETIYSPIADNDKVLGDICYVGYKGDPAEDDDPSWVSSNVNPYFVEGTSGLAATTEVPLDPIDLLNVKVRRTYVFADGDTILKSYSIVDIVVDTTEEVYNISKEINGTMVTSPCISVRDSNTASQRITRKYTLTLPDFGDTE